MPMSKISGKQTPKRPGLKSKRAPSHAPGPCIPGVRHSRSWYVLTYITVDWRKGFIGGARAGSGSGVLTARSREDSRTPGHHPACVTCREEQEAAGPDHAQGKLDFLSEDPQRCGLILLPWPYPQFQPRPGGISLGNHSL